MNLSVFGLGKLGAPLLAVFAHKGFNVIGVDINPELVSAINAGIAPFEEPGLQQLLSENLERITATSSVEEAVMNSDVSFLILPTPSKSDHFFSNDYLCECMTQIGNSLKQKDGYHLVVITSTVMPGVTQSVMLPILEQNSGKVVGEDLGLCYNPEFIALGSVVKDMLYPDLLLVGQSDEKAGQMLAEIYQKSVNNNPKIHRMNYVNAELAKISVNTFVTTKISYANMLADMCSNLPEADVDVVTNAIGDDSRIGVKYLRGGTAYGGPCFPRDNKAFAALGRSLGVNTRLAEATDEINEHQANRLSGIVETMSASGDCIVLLGVAYKPNTPVMEESQAIKLAKYLLGKGFKVVLSDPMAVPVIEKSQSYIFERDWKNAIQNADVIVIMTQWDEYEELPNYVEQEGLDVRLVIDPWRSIGHLEQDKNLKVISPGKFIGGLQKS